jgi:hypothetical protein
VAVEASDPDWMRGGRDEEGGDCDFPDVLGQRGRLRCDHGGGERDLMGVRHAGHGEGVAERRVGQILVVTGGRVGVVLGCGCVADVLIDGVPAGAGGFQFGGLGERLADAAGGVSDALLQVLDLAAKPSGRSSRPRPRVM